jgi:hypothetical protein
MMKTLCALLLAASMATLAVSCKSSSSAEGDLPCTCGTAMGDLEGCPNPICRQGKQNPDNPLCVCGTIDIPHGK